jgi:hypothetical protein
MTKVATLYVGLAKEKAATMKAGKVMKCNNVMLIVQGGGGTTSNYAHNNSLEAGGWIIMTRKWIPDSFSTSTSFYHTRHLQVYPPHIARHTC